MDLNGVSIWVWVNTYRYSTFLVGLTSIYQLFWGSLGTRVLTHPHMSHHVLKLVPLSFCRVSCFDLRSFAKYWRTSCWILIPVVALLRWSLQSAGLWKFGKTMDFFKKHQKTITQPAHQISFCHYNAVPSRSLSLWSSRLSCDQLVTRNPFWKDLGIMWVWFWSFGMFWASFCTGSIFASYAPVRDWTNSLQCEKGPIAPTETLQGKAPTAWHTRRLTEVYQC